MLIADAMKLGAEAESLERQTPMMKQAEQTLISFRENQVQITTWSTASRCGSAQTTR
jgi:hypothetical protein